ncbi:MAG: secreted glycosyl hydrolase, partial [Parcubacteria group bacterium Greene1014_15]
TSENVSAQSSAVSATTALSLPDLSITNLSAASSLIAAGQSTAVTATVQNTGTAPAAASMIAFKEMGMTLYEISVPALSAGGSASITQAMGSAPNIAARYRWSAKADSTNVITESNENNNVSSEIMVDTFVSTSTTTATTTASTFERLSSQLANIMEILMRLAEQVRLLKR